MERVVGWLPVVQVAVQVAAIFGSVSLLALLWAWADADAGNG